MNINSILRLYGFLGFSRVRGSVSNYATIGQNVAISFNSKIMDHATVLGECKIRKSRISGSSFLDGMLYIENSFICNSSNVTGFGTIKNSTIELNSTVKMSAQSKIMNSLITGNSNVSGEICMVNASIDGDAIIKFRLLYNLFSKHREVYHSS